VSFISRTAAKEERYQRSYTILSDMDLSEPCLFNEWDFLTEFCGLDDVLLGFQPSDAEDIYRWLGHTFFPSRVLLKKSVSWDEGKFFVENFAQASVIRSPLGKLWCFVSPNDALYFKLRYYG
jgi:hypothetical protein